MLRAFVARATAAILVAASFAAVSAPVQAQAAAGNGPKKIFRYAFPIAETGFDPAQISDLYSRTVTEGIFDSLLTYSYLERPVRIIPRAAAALPEISPDFKTFTFKVRPGIYFDNDPAFKGKKRELTAQDFVFAIKRHYDPRWKSAQLYLLEADKLLDLSELRQESIKNKTPFDYDREVRGVRALDRYTVQFNLGSANPRFHYLMTDSSVFGAVAREVVEAYGDKMMEHPVGTGAWRLKEWRRSSRIVLERNPNFREELYAEVAPADNPAAQASAARLKGRKMPMLDEVHISIIEEAQPRWLAFQNAEMDLMERLPNEFANIAIPNNELAPFLKNKGIQMERGPLVDVTVSYFGMENPIVGGYTPDKVALRRAIALAYNSPEEIRLVRRNQAVPSNGPIAPLTFGFDPKLRSEMSEFNVARAKALLDMYGYVDKNGDGWRDLPDGKPLVLEYSSQPDQTSRQLQEQWQKDMKRIGIKIEFKLAKWPEQLKQSRAGKLMMWGVGWSAGNPDGDTFLALGFGPNRGQANHARFDHPEFNKLYEAQRNLPDGPERFELMQRAQKIMVTYMPYKITSHRIVTDLTQPWVVGYHRNPFVRAPWQYLDVDTEKLPKK
ncbi:MAG TPA: ABC transporter substrate-binding protein [Burkholderiaceae bacterium]|nr:ABC transporter substrate-binding protein [Burkholderiaceae bacterium]